VFALISEGLLLSLKRDFIGDGGGGGGGGGGDRGGESEAVKEEAGWSGRIF